MTGYLILLGLIASTFAGLWVFGRVRGAALQVMLAALMLGGAGYALQGWPALEGAPRYAAPPRPTVPLTELRQAFFGTFSASERWTILSDSYARRGKTSEAVAAIEAGLRASPRDLQLLIAHANALVDHAGMITPAARLAFDRARAAAPDHPAPYFFEGLALGRSGDREAGLAKFRRALELAPADAGYRAMIAQGVEALATPLPRGPFQRAQPVPQP